MKRIVYFSAALTLGLAVSPLFAQDGPEEGMEPEHHEMAPEKMKAKLGLTDEQSEKFKAAHKAMQEAAKPLREKRRQLMKTLRDQVKSKAGDADIQATLDQMRDNDKAMRDAHQKMKDDLSAALTPTQRAKMVLSMMDKMRERRKERKEQKEIKEEKADKDSEGEKSEQ